MTADTRRRDAASTRQQLLDAARVRFARDGYNATSVRDIAGDAGVNVALISRYFESKEGLFRACLAGSADELNRWLSEDITLQQLPREIASKVVGAGPGRQPNRLLLLLRSSGDEGAERIRLELLRGAAQRLAVIAGRQPGQPDADRLLLGAQVALSAAFGVALLRASGMQPLAAADEDQLTATLGAVIGALLTPDPLP